DRDRVAEEALATTRSYCNEQIKPENIFVIGDTPNDVRCGQSIGARTVAVCTGNYSAAELSEVSPDFVFEDLSLAQPLIERLCAGHQNIESK
ncbi:MAG: HAD hydrolase-like protein, partial [Planctomycetota bacterium]|nr:HAD hydrolase-like protein [Planctomycetota bacterium]